MKENEWIDVKTAMPPLNVVVEVANFHDNGDKTLYHRKLVYSDIHHNYIWVIDSSSIEDYPKNVCEWRHITEKRPDFSKLNFGDFLYIEHIIDDVNFHCGGFLYDFDSYRLSILSEKNICERALEVLLKSIKRITRINLEEKTFEEI